MPRRLNLTSMDMLARARRCTTPMIVIDGSDDLGPRLLPVQHPYERFPNLEICDNIAVRVQVTLSVADAEM